MAALPLLKKSDDTDLEFSEKFSQWSSNENVAFGFRGLYRLHGTAMDQGVQQSTTSTTINKT